MVQKVEQDRETATGAAQDIQAEDLEAKDPNGKGKDCLRWARSVRKAGVLVYKEHMRQVKMEGVGENEGGAGKAGFSKIFLVHVGMLSPRMEHPASLRGKEGNALVSNCRPGGQPLMPVGNQQLLSPYQPHRPITPSHPEYESSYI